MSFKALLSMVCAASTEAEEGRRFERIVVWSLKNEPQYRDLFSDVWLWDDWSWNDGRDIGIDVVAQPKDGSLPWAVLGPLLNLSLAPRTRSRPEASALSCARSAAWAPGRGPKTLDWMN